MNASDDMAAALSPFLFTGNTELVSDSIDMMPGNNPATSVFEGEALDLTEPTVAIAETAYCWMFGADTISWEANALETLGVGRLGDIATGAAFQMYIAPEHIARRTAAMAFDTGVESATGLPYRLQYRLLPDGPRSDKSIWIEEQGRCWPDRDGKPAHARGVLRVITDQQMQDQRLLHLNDHDELTGLLNRIRMTEALAALVGRAERTRQPCGFLMISVNNLAMINETFGSAAKWNEPEKLIEALWVDPASRAIFTAVDAAARKPNEVIQTARKGYTAWSRRVQFAAAKPVKGGKVMLGLAVAPEANLRLEAPRNESWSERLKARVLLAEPTEVDAQIEALLRAAWERA